MANSLNELLAALDDSVSMEKSAQAQPAFADLDMDELIKMAEDEGERAAAEMAAADDARLTDAKDDEQKADEEKADAQKDDSEAKKDEDDMKKEAFLKKLAEIMVQDNGPAEANLSTDPTAEMVAMDDAKVMPTPGLTEGAGNLVEAIMARSEEAARDTGSGVEVGDGDDMADPEEDQVTKAAALDNLMEAGFSFDEAAEMVKAASAAVEAESAPVYSDMDKAAAVGQLMAQGVDFAQAVDLVKEAVSMTAIKEGVSDAAKLARDKIVGAASAAKGKAMSAGSAAKGKAMSAASAAKAGVTGAAQRTGAMITENGARAGRFVASHPRSFGAAGAVGAAGAAYGIHKHLKKEAEYDDMDKAGAVSFLLEQGIDFDTAVAAVQEAAE